MSVKEPKPPTLKARMDEVERLIGQEHRELGRERDPFALNRENPDEMLVEERERGDLQQALKNVAVRRVFYRMLKLGGMWESDSDPNPVIIAHHAGRRSLALDLYKALRSADAGVVWQMEREYESDLKSQVKPQEN